MSEQLTRKGVPFRFFDAERFRSYPSNYDAATRIKTHFDHMNLSEVGCYNSHYQIWQELVNSNDDVWCVLEDDVEVSDDFALRLSQAVNVAIPYGVMRLCEFHASGSWQVGTLPDGSALNDHRKQPTGMQGYLIRRAAAQILLQFAERILYPVDDMLNRNWEHGIRMLSLSPGIVTHRNDILGTTIGRQKANRSIPQRLMREFYRGRDSLNSYVYSWHRRTFEHKWKHIGI